MSFAGEAFTKDTYFNMPTQVAVMRVFDEGDVDTFVGVAYQDYVICLCCSTLFGVAELEEDDAVYKVIAWENCDRYIKRYNNPFDEDEESES